MSKYIVMTAASRMPSSCWGRYGKVAVVETDGINLPKQIHPNHAAVVQIVARWDRLFWGKTEKCAFKQALQNAKIMADRLNVIPNEPAD